jgi:hypothetical protein
LEIGLYCIFLCYLAGIRYNSNEFEAKYLLTFLRDYYHPNALPTVDGDLELGLLSKEVGVSSSPRKEKVSFYSSSTVNLSLMQSPEMNLIVAESIVESIHRIYLLKHHGLSRQFLEFFVWKGSYMFFSWCLSIGYLLCMFDSSTTVSNETTMNSTENMNTNTWFMIVGALVFVDNLYWIIWIIQVSLLWMLIRFAIYQFLPYYYYLTNRHILKVVKFFGKPDT